MTPERLQQIKDVDAKRTQGQWFVVGPPWRAQHDGEYVETYVVAGNPDPHGGTPVVDAIGMHEGTDEELRQHVVQSDADLGFCALASTAIPELVAEVERLTDALALGRKAASDATYDRESELAAMARKVRDLEAELLRCRTAENEAALALDKIRQDLGLDVGAGPMDVVRGVVGSCAQSRTTREHERRI